MGGEVRVPDCDHIIRQKLDPVLKSTLPSEAIRADGFLSQLHQFWQDVVAPLTAVIETADVGELRVKGTVMAALSALELMGNAYQKWCKRGAIRCCYS